VHRTSDTDTREPIPQLHSPLAIRLVRLGSSSMLTSRDVHWKRRSAYWNLVEMPPFNG
jgi:hypothetical protein